MNAHQEDLIGRYLDETLSEEDLPELQNLLRNNADARLRLRQLATVSESLEEYAHGAPSTAVLIPFPRWKLVLPWSIAAAACFVAMAALWVNSPRSGSGPRMDRHVTALLVDEAGAVFAEGQAPEDVRFGKGDFALKSGAVHVRFSNGADVVMKAPVEFTIDDAFHLKLKNGGLRAIVPPSAKGFTVATPGIDYEDLGTEFGLSVDASSGVSQLHVFDGQVDAKAPSSHAVLSSVRDGESVRFVDGDLKPAAAPSPDQFLTPGSIGYLRWETRQAEFASQPDLIGYFSFSDDQEEDVLRNLASNAVVSNGEVHGARWVSGRWSGKKALLFDRDDDFVELEIPGEFEELSFAAWIKLDRFDFSISSILDSNGWDRGDVHWQFSRAGTMWAASYEEPQAVLSERLIAPTNQWIHVAGTVSLTELTSCVYLNGKLAGAQRLAPNTQLKPGMCRMGNWLRDEKWPHVPIRALRGKIDEFAIWQRALEQSDVQELVDEGKPAALWTVRPR